MTLRRCARSRTGRRRGWSATRRTCGTAPAALQQLLSRLELADRLAAGGYALSLAELAQLVEQPLKRLEGRQGPWNWRNWQVLPAGEGRWRLRRDASGSVDTRDGDAQDG